MSANGYFRPIIIHVEPMTSTTVGGILNVTPGSSKIVINDLHTDTLVALVRMTHPPQGVIQRV